MNPVPDYTASLSYPIKRTETPKTSYFFNNHHNHNNMTKEALSQSYSSDSTGIGNRIRLDFGGEAPPFCGRQEELANLFDLFDEVLRTNKAASVWIEGVAGCGKSRLVDHFRQYIITRTSFRNTTTTATTTTQPLLARYVTTPSASTSDSASSSARPISATKPEISAPCPLLRPNGRRPPIFCSASFEEGQAASSEAMGPVLECFSQLTQALLEEQSLSQNHFWKNLLSLELKKDLTVLASMVPSFVNLVPVVAAAASSVPTTSAAEPTATTTVPPLPPRAPLGRSVTSTGKAEKSQERPKPKKQPSFLLFRSITTGAADRGNSCENAEITQSQPPPSLAPLPKMKQLVVSRSQLATMIEPDVSAITMDNTEDFYEENKRQQQHSSYHFQPPIVSPSLSSKALQPDFSQKQQGPSMAPSVSWQSLGTVDASSEQLQRSLKHPQSKEPVLAPAGWESLGSVDVDEKSVPVYPMSDNLMLPLASRRILSSVDENKESWHGLETVYKTIDEQEQSGRVDPLPVPTITTTTETPPDRIKKNLSEISSFSATVAGEPSGVNGVLSRSPYLSLSELQPTSQTDQPQPPSLQGLSVLSQNNPVPTQHVSCFGNKQEVSSGHLSVESSDRSPGRAILPKKSGHSIPRLHTAGVDGVPKQTELLSNSRPSRLALRACSVDSSPDPRPAYQPKQMHDVSMRSSLLRQYQAQSQWTLTSQRHAVNSRHPRHTSKNTRRRTQLVSSMSNDDSEDLMDGSKHANVSSVFLTPEQEEYNVDRSIFALREYLRCVCRERTVVFFFDDLQWSSHEAVSFFRALLSDAVPGSKTFLLLAAHRPLPNGHDVARLVSDMEEGRCHSSDSLHLSTNFESRSSPVRLLRLFIDNGKPHDMIKLVAHLLKREETDVRQLAGLVHRKTAGNFFFAIEFVRMLENMSLIHYSVANTRWEWSDLNEISARTAVSDNVVEVVALKIRDAPQDLKLALLTAASFGVTRFSAETLYRALPEGEDLRQTMVRAASTEVQLRQSLDESILSLDSLVSTLEVASDERFLESLGNYQYKWAHDRIREATVSLLPHGADLNMLRLLTGRQLRKCLDEQVEQGVVDEKLLLHVVIQLNQAAELIEDEDEKEYMSELNYAAAEYAIARSSFFPASDFLRIGIEFLGEDPWSNHYHQMMKLADTLMRMDYCCGRLVVSVELANEILAHAKCFEDRKMAYHIRVLWLTQNDQIKAALDLILEVLEELGAAVPRRFLRFHRMLDWFRTQRMLQGLSDQELLSLPHSTTKHIDDIGSFMERLEEVAMHGSNPQRDLLSVALLRVMQLTLRHGRFSMTPTCLVSWGWFNARLQRLDAAHRFGKLGVRLAEEGGGGHHDARATLMYYMYVYHWRQPYHDGIKPATEALQKLWDLGAIEYVFLDTITYLRIYFCCGLRLDPLMKDIRRYVELLKDYGHRLAFENHAAFFQCVANLMGNNLSTTSSTSVNETCCQLSGEFMIQDHAIAEWGGRNNDLACQQYYFQRMVLAYFFNDLNLAVEMSNLMWSPFCEGPDVFLPFRVFFMGMTALSSHNENGMNGPLLRQGKRMIRLMEKWDVTGVVNVHHMLVLLKAELNAGSKRLDFAPVRRSFDEAISKAARRGFLHFQAIASERAGIYCRKKKEHEWGRIYIVQARALYSEWGAMGKVRRMNQEYPSYLEGAITRSNRSSAMNARTRLGDLSKDRYVSGTSVSDEFRGSQSAEFPLRGSHSSEFPLPARKSSGSAALPS